MTNKRAEYAVSLRRRAQGKGIAAEATCEILKMAFEQYNLERVYLNVLSENKRAIRFYEKIEFIYEGEFRKYLFLRGEYKTLKWYSMLKEEYDVMPGGCYPFSIIISKPLYMLLDYNTCSREVA